MFDEGLQTVLDFDLWFKLAKTERFLFLPGVVVHSRAHPDQDTNRKRDIHMQEANELLARFVDELSAAEVRAGSSYTVVHGYYAIAQTLLRRNFSAAASHALAVAERMTRTAFYDYANSGGAASAHEANEALESLFALARRTVESEVTLQVPSDGRDSQHKSVALLEHRGVKRIVLSVVSVCMNNQFFRSAVRMVAESPSMQMMARRVARRLPLSTQYRLASIWQRYRN
jgi:hypothetical protein